MSRLRSQELITHVRHPGEIPPIPNLRAIMPALEGSRILLYGDHFFYGRCGLQTDISLFELDRRGLLHIFLS